MGAKQLACAKAVGFLGGTKRRISLHELTVRYALKTHIMYINVFRLITMV